MNSAEKDGAPDDLVAEDISKIYKPFRPAVAPVSLKMKQGAFKAIIGPSGCGKTTLLRLLSGLEEPTTGRVLLQGCPPEQFRRKGKLGAAFQDPALTPWLSVRENILLPSRILRRPMIEARIEADRLIDLVGLGGCADLAPEHLSGGMRQRVSIARALVTDPKVLLLDEPFGALDQILRRSLMIELQRIWTSCRTTTLLVTHSIEEAVFLSDRVLVMQGPPGRIRGMLDIPFGRPREKALLSDPSFHALCDRLAEMLEQHEKEEDR